MVMLSASSALVAGSVAAGADMKTQNVKVVRPFWFGGKQHYAGAVVEVPAVAAAELLAMGKATSHDSPPPKLAPAKVEPNKLEPNKESK